MPVTIPIFLLRRRERASILSRSAASKAEEMRSKHTPHQLSDPKVAIVLCVRWGLQRARFPAAPLRQKEQRRSKKKPRGKGKLFFAVQSFSSSPVPSITHFLRLLYIPSCLPRLLDIRGWTENHETEASTVG